VFKQHFGMKSNPFDKEIDCSDLYAGGDLKELESRLKFMLENRGIFLLVGEPGSGKTTAEVLRIVFTCEASDTRDEETQLFLKKTLAAYETVGYDGIYSAIETAEYAAIIENDPTYPVIYLDESDKYGSGIYQIESGVLFAYIGGYANRLRSGHGVWVWIRKIQSNRRCGSELV